MSIEAEKTVNAYARARYGFAPGDQFQMGYPDAERPVTLRVHKVFLQSGTESDVRVDASLLEKDGARGDRWDVYMKGPGEFQFDKIQRKEILRIASIAPPRFLSRACYGLQHGSSTVLAFFKASRWVGNRRWCSVLCGPGLELPQAASTNACQHEEKVAHAGLRGHAGNHAHSVPRSLNYEWVPPVGY